MSEEVIKHKKRMGQLKSFRELFIGKHTPSDIDLAYEIGGRVFVFGELKLAGVDVPTGQKLLLQHIGEALFEADKNSANGDLQAAIRFAQRRRLGPFAKRYRARYQRIDTHKWKKRDLSAMARAGFSKVISQQVLDHDNPDTINDLLCQTE